jgi:Rrf2 family protein
MKLSHTRRTDYALAALIVMAEQSDRILKVSEIAAAVKVSRGFLHLILGDLVRAQLVGSRPGPNGGYVLSRDASKISVLDVVDATEGPLEGVRCSLQGMPCRWEPVCPRLHSELEEEQVCLLNRLWKATRTALVEHVERITIAELAARDMTSLGITGCVAPLGGGSC